MSSPSFVESRQIEHDYARYREEIMGLLTRGFSRLPDHEEIYQEAWTELLEMQAKGKPVGDLRMVLRTIAWRRARDRVRSDRADPFDPASHLFGAHAPATTPPDEEAQIHLDAAIARQVVDSLDERHAAVIKLRFESHMDSREIQQRLGVSAKRLEKIVTEAYHRVEAQLAVDESGESPYRRRQRSLLLACLLGQASAAQVQRARRMVAEDAGCRAILRQLHFTMDRIAALAPMPVLVDREFDWGIPVFDRVGNVPASLKRVVANALSRGEAHVSPEQAAGGAATIGAGAAAKVALTCVAIGATAVCLDRGSSPGHYAPPHRPAPADHHDPPPTRVVARAPATQQAPVTHGATRSTPSASRSASAPPRPSPAPAGSTEFGPGNVGSQGASSTPAAASSGGGGEFLP
ncbi:MAG: sigma-70 family polymerase sigma factor [Solirubrobacterales bacterium]|nr:sigma-70 family polymerase sigma factor [Solirubrobacterales bacterium]